MMNEMMEMKNLITEMDVKNRAMEHNIQELTDEVDNLKRSLHENPIMFHAKLSSDRRFEDGSTIVFDTVITNVGGGYALAVGVFQCPVSGYYFFAVSLIADSYRAHGAIMMNDINKQIGPLTGYDDNRKSGMSIQTLITECQANSIVYVQAKHFSSP